MTETKLLRRVGSKQKPKVFHAEHPRSEGETLCSHGNEGEACKADLDAWPERWWRYCNRCFDRLTTFYAAAHLAARVGVA